MIKYDKPFNLNGKELIDELMSAGVVVNTQTSPLIDGNGDFWLDIDEADKAKAEAVVLAHNGTTIAPDNSTAKTELLAKLGITQEEAKLLLS